MMVVSRDVVLTKKVWERIQKTAISKKSFKVILKDNVKKEWERRFHTKKKCESAWSLAHV